MMNFVAFGLLLSSLGVAVIWTPQPSSLARHSDKPLVRQAQASQRAGWKDIESLEDVATRTGEAIRDGVTRAKASVASHAVEKVLDGAYVPSKETLDSMKSAAKRACEIAEDNIEAVGDEVGALPRVARNIEEKFEDIGNKATELQQAAFQKVGDVGQYAADRIKRTSEEIYSSVQDKVWQTRETLTDVKDSLKDKYDEAKQGVQEKVRDSRTSSMPNLGEGLGWLTREDANLHHQSMEDKNAEVFSGEQGYDKAENYLQEAQEAINHAAKKLGEAIGVSNVDKSESKHLNEKDGSIYKEENEAITDMYQGHEEKVGAVNDNTKDRLFETGGRKPWDEDEGILSRKVHEFCQWFSQEASKRYQNWTEDEVERRSDNLANSMAGEYDPGVDSAEGLGEPVKAASQSSNKPAEVNLSKDDHSGTLNNTERSWKVATDGARGSFWGSIPSRIKGQAGDMKQILQQISGTGFKRFTEMCYAFLPLLHLFSFSLVYGTSMWVTFISGYLLSHVLPSQQLGLVQSKIFPVYLRMLTSGTAVCFLLHGLMHPWGSAEPSERGQYWSLLVS
eukprot:c22473_g2_i1 orf=1-1686(-)